MRSELLAHHGEIGLESARSEDHRIARDRLGDLALRHRQPGDAVILGDDVPRRAAVAERHAGLLGGARQCADDRRAAARRLDARRTFRQVVRRLDEFDAVPGNPRNGRGCVLGEPSEVRLVTLELRGGEHVVHEARLDAIGRGHAHVGGRPARVAAGFFF
jgi:hypothetical protein